MKAMTDRYENIRKMQPKLIKLIRGLTWDAERYRRLRENCVVWAEDTDEPY